MAENLKPKIAIILEDKELESEIGAALEEDYDLDFFSNGVVLYNSLQRQKEGYTFIISVSDLKGLHGFRLIEARRCAGLLQQHQSQQCRPEHVAKRHAIPREKVRAQQGKE